MFESIWDNPATVEDVTERVAEQVETLYRENAPEFVYFLTLYHLFREYMDDEEDNGIRSGLNFEDSAIWGKLYDFQKDAVVGAIHKLEKYKGCIIADSVGLGKTYEALAVIKYYQERNDRILVLCPKLSSGRDHAIPGRTRAHGTNQDVSNRESMTLRPPRLVHKGMSSVSGSISPSTSLTTDDTTVPPNPLHPRAPARRRRATRESSRSRSEERRVGKECRSRWSPYH